jgi:hypothetical protein
MERKLLGTHWPSAEERRLYTKYFLLEHYRFYTGEELDSDALSIQLVYYERIFRNARPEGGTAGTERIDEIHDRSGAMGWLEDAVKTPQECQQERDRSSREVSDFARWEAQEEAKEKEKKATHERKQLQIINMLPSPNAFHGIEIYFLAEDALPSEEGKKVQMEGEPELPPEQRLGVDPDMILHLDTYDLWPNVVGEPGKPTLHSFVAVNRERKRAEYIVGPLSVDSFVENLEDYRNKARIYYMTADMGAQPSGGDIEKIRMSDAVFQKGNYRVALWHWGYMWTRAVRSPRWWLAFGMSGLMAGAGGEGPAGEVETGGAMLEEEGLMSGEEAAGMEVDEEIAENTAGEATEETIAGAGQMAVRRGCFVAGTNVFTPDGEKAIEHLVVGEAVQSFDPVTGKNATEAVVRTFVRTVSAVLDIRVGSELITCSPEHPFWVPGSGWRKAGELDRGSYLLTRDGYALRIDSVQRQEGTFSVFNIEVEGMNTYFVSRLGILVHNKAMEASKKSILKDAQLPTSGRLRYVPPKNWRASQPLPRGTQNGYIDRFGNEWVRGPSRTQGQAFEWDVQLSNTGKSKIGWLSRDPDQAHVNVSLDGEVTH